MAFYAFCRKYPALARRLLRGQARSLLPDGYPLDPHFAPTYQPWDQRLCLVPDHDLYRAVRKGRASVVTDTIETFTERGVRLASGEELEADVIVTATGLKVIPCGGIGVDVDGRPIQMRDALIYKGLMLSGVPNLAWCIGYINASWTLRSDLSARYVCRLLQHMDRHKYDRAEPNAGAAEVGERRPILDLSSGYISRVAHEMPKQGTKGAWRLRQNYVLDMLTMVYGRVDDPAMTFSKHPADAPRAVHATP
jgi:monooxygenase